VSGVDLNMDDHHRDDSIQANNTPLSNVAEKGLNTPKDDSAKERDKKHYSQNNTRSAPKLFTTDNDNKYSKPNYKDDFKRKRDTRESDRYYQNNKYLPDN
jgi:hypothetical protein